MWCLVCKVWEKSNRWRAQKYSNPILHFLPSVCKRQKCLWRCQSRMPKPDALFTQTTWVMGINKTNKYFKFVVKLANLSEITLCPHTNMRFEIIRIVLIKLDVHHITETNNVSRHFRVKQNNHWNPTKQNSLEVNTIDNKQHQNFRYRSKLVEALTHTQINTIPEILVIHHRSMQPGWLVSPPAAWYKLLQNRQHPD